MVVHRDPDLLQIVAAARPARGLARGLDRWQQKRHKHADDGDHYQQFNERERPPNDGHGQLVITRTTAREHASPQWGGELFAPAGRSAVCDCPENRDKKRKTPAVYCGFRTRQCQTIPEQLTEKREGALLGWRAILPCVDAVGHSFPLPPQPMPTRQSGIATSPLEDA
jgi:hypothetical protein